MDIKYPFGFVTGCHAGDRFMVGATLASIRHYCPQTPICLVVDGDFDVSDLEKQYKLIVLRISELPSSEMKNLTSGNFRAKLAPMWEGPFESYVWMDSDAILWGDIIPFIKTEVDFQIFAKKAVKKASETPVDENHPEVQQFMHFMFNPFMMLSYDPDFEWRDNDYFCAGVLGAKKNAITFDEWMNAERLAKSAPGLFSFDDMGILNYLVHKKRQLGQIKTITTDLQALRTPEQVKELENDLFGSKYNFPHVIRNPRIVHFCGVKPFIINYKSYCRPFTIARLSHHRKMHSIVVAWMIILKEELKIFIHKTTKRIRRFTSAFLW